MTLKDLVPFGMEPADFFVALMAVAACVGVVAFYNTMLVKDPIAPRVKALKERRDALRAGILTPTRRRERAARGVGLMRKIVTQLKLMRFQRSSGNSIQLKLAGAGWRSKDALVVYVFAKAALPIAFGAVAAFFMFGFGAYDDLQMPAKLGICAVSLFVGFVMPDVLVKNQATKRQTLLRKAMPDTLDLMVICAEAGLSMDSAFSRVSREMAQASPVMSDEIGLTSIELSFLPERSKALQNLTMRTSMPEMRGMVNTLMQTEKYGTPLAQALRVLAAEFRNERLLRAEEKAARLPAILTVPMILFILPCLFIVLLGPAAMRTIDALGGVS